VVLNPTSSQHEEFSPLSSTSVIGIGAKVMTSWGPTYYLIIYVLILRGMGGLDLAT
jgi:hypothetical protein